MSSYFSLLGSQHSTLKQVSVQVVTAACYHKADGKLPNSPLGSNCEMELVYLVQRVGIQVMCEKVLKTNFSLKKVLTVFPSLSQFPFGDKARIQWH